MKIIIPPNTVGLIYKNNQFVEILQPGIKRYFTKLGLTSYTQYLVPTSLQTFDIATQDVMTSDSISFKFSAFVQFIVVDVTLLNNSFNLTTRSYIGSSTLEHVVEDIRLKAQLIFRDVISNVGIEELILKKDEINLRAYNLIKETINSTVGLEIIAIGLKDMMLPKTLQDLFTKKLESQFANSLALTQAKEKVAIIRTLKNASEMMAKDPVLKDLLLMDKLETLSNKTRLTVVFGKE
jgi:regulator of protease activity HflC (stomatin/prohibitin superfamily)